MIRRCNRTQRYPATPISVCLVPTNDTTVSISSLSEYVAHVEATCAGEVVLFRGQAVDKPLLPKIARLNTALEVQKAERRMFDDFKRQALPHLDYTPESDWDWLSLAQHSGMATRLLDWSTNPLAALWFVVERPPRDEAPGVIWHFEAKDEDFLDARSSLDPFSITKTRIFRPRHITQRITSQSGYFSAHRYLETKNEEYMAFENNSRFKKRLTKLLVPAAAFSDLRRDLDRFGINAASLYGGMDGVCRHIEWLHSYLEDERDDDHRKESLRRSAD